MVSIHRRAGSIRTNMVMRVCMCDVGIVTWAPNPGCFEENFPVVIDIIAAQVTVEIIVVLVFCVGVGWGFVLVPPGSIPSFFSSSSSAVMLFARGVLLVGVLVCGDRLCSWVLSSGPLGGSRILPVIPLIGFRPPVD